MQFVDSLPEGLNNTVWTVTSSWGDDLAERLLSVVGQKGLFLDLSVRRDNMMAQLRIVPNIAEGFIPDRIEEAVYHFYGATAFFVGLDGAVTDCIVEVNFSLHTHAVPGNFPIGYVTIMHRSDHIHTAAS